MTEKKRVYTIYKIKPDTEYSGIYSTKALEKAAFDERILIKNEEHRFIVSNNAGKLPDWLSELCRVGNKNIIQTVASAGGILEVKIDESIYCVAFGTKGRHLINSTVIEDRFGLITALNMIGDNPIRQIDKTTLDSNQKHSKEQLSKEGSAREFGINYSQDILKGVSGKPEKEKEFLRVSGSDSLNIKTIYDYAELKKVVSLIDDEYKTERYKQKYAWIDKFTLVKDSATIADLEGFVEQWLSDSHPSDAVGWFSVPHTIEWERIDGFYYSGSTDRSDIYSDIDLQYLVEAWAPEAPNLDAVKKRSVQAINVDGSAEYTWQIYRCLHFEATHNQEQYILSDGKWYKVDAEYSKELNQFYDGFAWIDLNWGKYNHKSETLYNSSLDGTPYLVVFDKKLIYLKGEDPIEFCDAFDISCKRFIHIKRYGQSAVLSHLFSQGYVSADLFWRNATFRKAVLDNEKAKGRDLGFTANKKPSPPDFTVVYGIISSAPDPKPQIPYFSKISLRNYSERLSGIGYNVALAKIECDDGVKIKSKRRKKTKPAISADKPPLA